MRRVLMALSLIVAPAAMAEPFAPADYCAKLERVIAAARETPIFASLRNPDGYSAQLLLGSQCSPTPSSYVCYIPPADIDALPAQVERCLAGRFEILPPPAYRADNPSERRYLVDGDIAIRLGCYTTMDIIGNRRTFASISLQRHAADEAF